MTKSNQSCCKYNDMAKLSRGLTEVVQRLNEKCKFTLVFFKKDVVS